MKKAGIAQHDIHYLHQAMTAQTSQLKGFRVLFGAISIAFTTWAVSFLSALLLAAILLGHIPSYGDDTDPSFLNFFPLHILQWLNFLSFLFSMAGFLFWPLLLIHLVMNKVPFTRKDKLLHAAALLSVFIYLLFRFFWMGQFLWMND